VSFFISLDRLKVCNRAIKGLFFILMSLSLLNFENVDFHSVKEIEFLILTLLPFGGFFAYFDLAGLNQLPRASYSRQNPIPQVNFTSMSW
jgi:hypothetical protein